VTFSLLPSLVHAQNSAMISGTVTDPTGAIVPKAAVEIHNPVSGYDRTAETDTNGSFSFANVPFNPYHLTVMLAGFNTFVQDVDVRSTVPISLKISLSLAGASSSVTVEAAAADLIETEPTAHTDVDRQLFQQLPLESASSSISSLITLSAPGITADSNGLFHGLGDHAENSFSIDGQPITDQQSKVFSNQIPEDSVQSMEVIQGAPPAEFGGKTSVVVKVTTRSGLGAIQPTGDFTTSYGSFGTATAAFDLSWGGPNWGEYIAASGLNTGRFLDGPEYTTLHDKGNEENVFNRFDIKLNGQDTLQLNLEFTRSWFQNPNTWDQQLEICTVLSVDCTGAAYAPGSVQANPLTGSPLGPTDQRSQIRTFNVAPTFVHLIGTTAVFTFGPYIRHDQYNYYPSNDPFSDLGDLQDETIRQLRFLTNAGVHTDISYAKGINNIKVGAVYEHTFLTENDTFGVINPGLLAGCTTTVCTTLAPYDLTNPVTDPTQAQYPFHGHTDVKEIALYAQDTITKGPWTFNIGLRGDFYNGLQAKTKQAEPRAGIAYNIKKTNTVLRVSYARTMESPFNENLILSGTGCNNPVVDAIMTLAQGFACTTSPLTPGFRNEFHAGLEEAFGKHFVLSGEYIWKYTHNGYDFNVFGTTPITLPIEWHNSKIPGFAVRGSFPQWHGLTAFIVLSHVSARFFPPTVSGIAPPQPPGVFRIDHDEIFNQTTHAQYQPFKRGPWFGVNWRYDSGLVSGAVPCLAATATCAFTTSALDGGAPPPHVTIPQGDIGMFNGITGLPLTADQEFQAGLTCNGVHATITSPLPTFCPASEFGSTLVKIPATGTENDDHNPQRIQPRNLFDLALGEDNLFNGDRYKWSLRFTVINLTNKEALYNFLSTFSGTHYVTPRTETMELGFHF
ncbi:MAG TPA: carboxypeptidase regulatory-like domain-containing protein, partial [Blastocatellia bacterium]